MENDNTINQEPPKTYAQVCREMNWGGVNYLSNGTWKHESDESSLSVNPNSDSYLAGTIPSLQALQQRPEDKTLPEDLPSATIKLADIALPRGMFSGHSKIL